MIDLLQQSKFTVRAGGGPCGRSTGVSRRAQPRPPVGWFYYVNGIEADQDAGKRKLNAGDRVWWDHHDADAAAKVPAVVGAFPEPFVSGTEGKKLPIRLVCMGDAGRSCNEVEQAAAERGHQGLARSSLEQSVGEVLRILVGPWTDVRKDIAARSLEDGPATVRACSPSPNRAGSGSTLLDADRPAVKTLGPGGGLVAATTFTDQQPTWIVTGTDEVGVAAAAAAHDRGRARRPLRPGHRPGRGARAAGPPALTVIVPRP